MTQPRLIGEAAAHPAVRYASARSPGSVRRAAGTAWARSTTHPVALSFVAALTIRLVAIAGIALAHPAYLFPDEADYVEFGRLSASGHLTPAIAQGYGEALFHEAASFMWPLAILFRIFGGHPILGALWAALFGAITAALVALLVSQVLTRGWALLAGLTIALFPSQILWSSVVLRESMVWAALAGAAVGVTMLARAKRWTGLVSGTVVVGGSLFAAAYLRNWAFVPAAWATAIAPWLFRPARRGIVRSACLALCLLVPLAAGLGPAAASYVKNNGNNLAYVRSVLAQGANSAFVHPRLAHPTSSANAHATTSPSQLKANESQVATHGLKSDLRALPRGLVAFLLRPFPFQHGKGLSYDFAGLEELLYYPLYLLAVIGLFAYRRRRDLIAFPVLVAVIITGVAAEAEGNLGSAFRHRDQLLWVLVVLAALGTNWLWSRFHEAWQNGRPGYPSASRRG